ncbi:MAG TPA: class I SAM-dependent methyltransferase [Acidimicrobiales bacterium]|nr:class I SAM-dependent methyltransferase [Acidimicrobiales bacterium]
MTEPDVAGVGGEAGEGALLAGQLDYYRARAGEYDRWFRREGRYDRGELANAAWFAEAAEVRGALRKLAIDGAEVVELAGGTGIWTAELVGRARSLVVVDGAAEMIAENRRRLGSRAGDVEYVEADLFEWHPHRHFDAVVFCFFVSHVPDSRLGSFLDAVAGMLRPHGEVFFLDGLAEPSSTAADHVLPQPGDETMLRRLDDGREYRIVKRFRTNAELESACRAAGLQVAVATTATYFQYGIGRRAGAPHGAGEI